MVKMHENSKFCFPDIRTDAASTTKTRDADRIVINVGGHKHETHLSTLRNFPDTRLSWMAESPLTKGCHTSDDGNPTEYFFDRHPGVFVHILNYYRTGKLHCPSDVCGPLFEEELNFWGIDELQMEPCCWSTYTRHRDAQAFEKVFTVNTARQGDDVSDDGEPSGMGSILQRQFWYNSYKQKIWDLLEKPYSSKGAQILALVSLMVIITSVVTFCLESIPELESYRKTFQILDYAYCAVFTLDFIARVLSCPDRGAFFRNALTWCDIMSVIPFYTNMIWTVNYLNVVLVVRLFRIFRLFRFFRFMSGMQVIGHTLRASARELMLLVLILLIPMVIFSSLLFYTEKAFDGDPRFYSIPHSFWWAVITMTTVGYGDIYPQTALGRFIGTMCACSGVLIVALPVSVIGSNFSLFYSHAQAQLKLPRKRKQPILVGAASALMSAVDQELTTSSETESDPEYDSSRERKPNGTSKCLLEAKDRANDVQVKNIPQKRKNLEGSYAYNSTHSLKTKQKPFLFGHQENGLEKGLKAMGDIMLHITAPAQRRMAISGISVSHSPSLRRSNSGKRRTKSKSGDSLRKRAHTLASGNFKNNVPEQSAGKTTDEAIDDTFSRRDFSLPKSDSCPVVQFENNGKLKNSETPRCELNGDTDCQTHFGRTESDEQQSERSGAMADLSYEHIQENEIVSYERYHALHEQDTKGTQSIDDVDLNKEGIRMSDIRHTKNSPTHSESSNTSVVADYNKCSPWYEGEANVPILQRFGRRRSATINICTV